RGMQSVGGGRTSSQQRQFQEPSQPQHSRMRKFCFQSPSCFGAPALSKAVGGTQPTALPSSPRPYRASSLPRHRQGRRTETDAQSDRRSLARSSAHACAFRATLCEKKRSGGTNCRGPTYASIWGMRDAPAMDNAEPYDLVTVLSRLEDLRGMAHEIG